MTLAFQRTDLSGKRLNWQHCRWNCVAGAWWRKLGKLVCKCDTQTKNQVNCDKSEGQTMARRMAGAYTGWWIANDSNRFEKGVQQKGGAKSQKNCFCVHCNNNFPFFVLSFVGYIHMYIVHIRGGHGPDWASWAMSLLGPKHGKVPCINVCHKWKSSFHSKDFKLERTRLLSSIMDKIKLLNTNLK